MIHIVQAGQAGKTKYLFDMHRLRTRIFRDRMGWDVQINDHGLEVDQFDLPEAIYLLACDERDRVIGSWRLLPSTGPTMIRDVWPDFLETIDMPASETVWEASRFGVNMIDPCSLEDGLARLNQITAHMFCALTELCIHCGIERIYTMYDMRIARLLKRLACEPSFISGKIRIDDHMSQVGCFDTDQRMLDILRNASGFRESLINPDDLPFSLLSMHTHKVQKQKEKEYA